MGKKKTKTDEPIDYKKEFMRVFNALAYKYSRHRVWSDFVFVSACAISNQIDKRYFDEREEQYLKIVGQYEREEVDEFSTMLGYTIGALSDNPEQDFLGSVFGLLNLNNEWAGQFFTPYHIGALMSKLTLTNDIEPEREQERPITVSDPCCGAGCLLIGCFNDMKSKGIDVGRDLVLFGQDIDQTAALMCYIQLSLLGANAVIKIGNSLTNPMTEEEDFDESYWLTPKFIHTAIEKQIVGTK